MNQDSKSWLNWLYQKQKNVKINKLESLLNKYTQLLYESSGICFINPFTIVIVS